MIVSPRVAQFSWALFDWASSAFSAVIITFIFATYFSQGIAVDKATGTAQWGWALSASGIAIALLSPVLGAIADAGGRRKPWLFAFTCMAVIGCWLLWYARPDPGWVIFTLVVVAVANTALEVAGMFYNAMLPEIVSRDYLGRLSGWAWGLGYAGGLVCLILALVAFVQPEPPLFGLDKHAAEQVRITGPLVGTWLALFSLPLLLFTPDRKSAGLPPREAVRRGLAQLRRTIADIRRYRQVGLFLIARMIYIDGLNTLFAFGGIYAAGTFGMELAEVIYFGILLNITAGLGALALRLGRRLARREAHHPDRARGPARVRRRRGARDQPAGVLDRGRAARHLRRAQPGGEPLADGAPGAAPRCAPRCSACMR